MSLSVRTLIIVTWITLIFALLWTASREWMPNKDEKSIQIFAWPNQFSSETIREFEEETGIKVKLSNFTTNEELMVKLKAGDGKGYDLITPSDYAVDILTSEGLLKKLDHSKLPFINGIDPSLVGHDFDPDNSYSLPYQWEIFAFGIDRDVFKDTPFLPDWKQVFNPKEMDYKIAMVNDPIEAISFASYYLYGKQSSLDSDKVRHVEQLLAKQKPLVEAYAGLRADYLLMTKNCPVALSTTSYLLRAEKKCPRVACLIPNDWSFISIENVCIPKNSTKEEWVYEFLNFAYRPEILGRDVSIDYQFPATLDSLPYLNVSESYKMCLQDFHNQKRTCHFIRHLMPEKESRKLWVKVKS